MSHQRQKIGRDGEDLARAHCMQDGYRVVASNARTRAGEIDLVCLDGEILVVVEVRAVRSPGGPRRAVDRVDWKKARQVVRAARWWLHSAGQCHGTRDIRFDVIGVDMRSGELQHIEDAFRADDYG